MAGVRPLDVLQTNRAPVRFGLDVGIMYQTTCHAGFQSNVNHRCVWLGVRVPVNCTPVIIIASH